MVIDKAFAYQLAMINRDNDKVKNLNNDIAFYGQLFRYDKPVIVKSDQAMDVHRAAAR